MNRLKNIIKKENRYYLISWLLLITVFLFTCIFFERKITGQLNSDTSGEMMLSKLLAENGNIMLSPKWYYSTELRVLNVQIIWGLLFRFISNWHVIRVTGTIIWWIVLLLSVYGLCKVTKLDKYYPIMATCFLSPISSEIYGFYLVQLWYMTHVIISINLLTLGFKYLDSKEIKIKFIMLLFGFVLALFAGLGGVRHIMVFAMPYIAAFFIYGFGEYKKNKKVDFKDFVYVVVSSVGLMIGFLINSKVLHHFYSFDSFEGSAFTLFDFNRFFEIVNGFISTSGYISGNSVFSLSLIKNSCSILIIIICIYAVYKTLKKRKELERNALITNYFFIFGMIVMTLVQTMTSTIYQIRYFLPIYLFSIFLVFIIINNEKDSLIKKLLLFVFVGCYLVCGLLTFNDSRNNLGNTTKQEVADFLVKNGYYNGYSFFWDGNVITELSNGEIEVWSWGFISTTDDAFKDIYFISPWLQNKDHMSKTPKGKIFILLSNEANDKFKDLIYFFTESDIVYLNKDYIVYGFESFEELKKIMHIQ